jgi:hypothetical protein
MITEIYKFMPMYDIRNKKNGKTKEIFCSYNDKEKALKEQGPDWEYIIVGAPGLQHMIGGQSVLKKAGSGWNDHLNRIKQNSGKDNTINTR